jgi:hypothetical protein
MNDHERIRAIRDQFDCLYAKPAAKVTRQDLFSLANNLPWLIRYAEDAHERLVRYLAESLWYEAAGDKLRADARAILDKGDYDALLTGPRNWWHAEQQPWLDKAREMLKLQAIGVPPA